MHKPVSYGSVCSGIEAASVAWHCLGWQPAWFAEIEKFPSAVLAYRWPDVSNLGDMTQIAAAIRAGKIDAPDVLVGEPLTRHSALRVYVMGWLTNAAS